MIERIERQRLAAGAARRGDRGADRPGRPRDRRRCSHATPGSGALPRRAVAREPPGRAPRPLEVQLDRPRARRAQRDDAPAAERAAVDVRLAALRAARARRASGKRQSVVSPALVTGLDHGAVAPSRRAARVDLPVDEVGPERRARWCRWRPGARSRGAPPAAGTTHSECSQPNGSPSSSMPEEGHVLAVGRPARRRSRSRRGAPSSRGSPPLAATTCTAGALAEVGVARPGRRRTRCASRPATSAAPSTDQSPRVMRRARAPGARRLDVEVHVAVAIAARRRGASRRARSRARAAARRSSAARRRSASPAPRRASASRVPSGDGRERRHAVRQRGQLLGLAAGQRHRPDLLVAQEEHAVAGEAAATESRTSPAVSARARPAVQRDDPDVPPVAARPRDAARVERVALRRDRQPDRRARPARARAC